MSNKKPNLTIEIQELGDQYNSKFQGYVEYPVQNVQVNKKYGPNIDLQNSRASHKSNQSNVSNRSALLQRAQHLMLQQRLAQNMKSLSKNKMKSLANSRNRQVSDSRQSTGKYKFKNQQVVQKKQIIRSKSASSLNAENSRAKVLQEIADKLKKIERIKKDQIVQNKVQVNSAVSRIHSEQNQQVHSRVERIKQIKQQMSKNRGGKLQHLLKDIKKSNKQAYKVVYTIKKSSKNASPFQKSLLMRDKIYQQTKKNVAVTNAIGANLFNTTVDKSDSLRKLAQEIHNVRVQLKQVKNKNQQLLQLSQYRSAHTSFIGHNLDTGSQSSRITHKMQTVQLDSISNTSAYAKNSPKNGSGTILHPSFTKIDKNNSYYNRNVNQGYEIIQQPHLIQPCFACGCTCRSKVNMVK